MSAISRFRFANLMVAFVAGLFVPEFAAHAQPTVEPTPILGATSTTGDDRPDRNEAGVGAQSPSGPVELGRQAESPNARADREAVARLRELQAATPPKPIIASEFELFVERTLGRKLTRYGNALLIPEARDFALPANATVPPDYILGPGDSVAISFTGSIEGNFNSRIDNDGRMLLPRVGPVKMGGVRYGDLRARVTAAMGQQFRGFTTSVTVNELRGIRVYVTGFAASPGAYTVSSLSTMVNAVLAAGGPSSGGSFRKATLRRGGRLIAELDLYDLLLRGDRSRDAVLQNEDVINIAPLGEQAALIGSVNAEAVYEVKPGESLEALLTLAGGPGVLADTKRMILFRTRDSSALIGRDVSREEAGNVAVVGGDIVSVLSAGSLQQPQQRQAVLVRLEGEVMRPGNYLVKPGTNLGEVLAEAGGLTPQAFAFGTRIERLSVKLQQRAGFLEAVDQLELTLAATPLTSNELDIGAQARGLSAARAVLDRLRKADPDGRLVLDIPSDAVQVPGTMLLENSDRIVIPPRPSAVGVFGAVYRPASFVVNGPRGLTVREYLARAGGPIRAADLGRMFVVRANGEVLTRKMGAMNTPTLPGDIIFIPIKTQSNNLLAKLRDIATVIFQLGITTAALVASTQ